MMHTLRVIRCGCMILCCSLSWGAMGCSADPSNKDLSQRDVRQILFESLKDDQNDRDFNLAMSSKFAWLGYRFYRTISPTSYAKERLISEGRSVIPVLREVADDPTEKPELRFKAAAIAGEIDPPWYALWLTKNPPESPYPLINDLERILPLTNQVCLQLEKRRDLGDWFRLQMRKPDGYDGILIWACDSLFVPNRYEGDGGMYDGDPRIMRWFDRVDDLDLSDFLNKQDPAVAAFRAREITKGYDPLILFQDYLTGNEREIRDAVSQIYQSPDDRASCMTLIKIVYPDFYNCLL